MRVDDADRPGVIAGRDLALLRHLNPDWTDKGAAAQPVHMAIITVRGADGGGRQGRDAAAGCGQEG